MELTDVWKTLHSDISNKICNSLIHVRSIDERIKKEIHSQRWMLTKILSWYLEMYQFHSRLAFSSLRRDLGIDTNTDINSHWLKMTSDERLEFFYAPYGPGTEEGKQLITQRHIFEEWIEETRDF